MFAGKPIIGIAGGIGSGKSFVANLFAALGCVVISSDEQVRDGYREGRVRATLQQWWGDEVLSPEGQVNRRFIAGKVFEKATERERLERLLHPLVNEARHRVMSAVANDAAVVAFVWDTPLLFETKLNRQCDAVVYVHAPSELRRQRVQESRGWDTAELARRENAQMPLDSKQNLSHHVIDNTADADAVRGQVRVVLSEILRNCQ